MKYIKIINETNPLTTILRVKYCQSFICQLRGLSFRKKLPLEEGLLLVQSQDTRINASIHMMGMYFDLTIVWINKGGKVVDLRLARRWISMFVPKKPASFTMEISAERFKDFNIGDKIIFEEFN